MIGRQTVATHGDQLEDESDGSASDASTLCAFLPPPPAPPPSPDLQVGVDCGGPNCAPCTVILSTAVSINLVRSQGPSNTTSTP
jgi:hypothetical protein